MAELDAVSTSTKRFMGNSTVKPKKRKSILEEVGHELKVNEPRVVSLTRKKFGADRALKQKRAILLSKDRHMGAKIPKGKGLKPS